MQTVPDVAAFLSDPASYKSNPASVEIRETHISKVFLIDRFAFKLKKPVRFDFLDFSTIDLRHKACIQEVDLNRRLAPDVYVGVVPVCQDENGDLSINGDGDAVDWLVKMKRLEDSKSLVSFIEQGMICERYAAKLADRLSHFYVSQAPQTIKSDDFRLAIAKHIQSNRNDLSVRFEHHEAVVNLTYTAQIRFVRLMADLFNDRVCDGRIVDGHGDLRPEHIYFAPNAIAIDCIEFNDEFRRNDIVDELSFLAMECDRLDAAWVGETILNRYSELSSDFPSKQLVAFYKCYRACVRAKVAAIRSDQTTGAEKEIQRSIAEAYLSLAGEYVPSLSPPIVITVGGLMGTGKSTLADQIAEELHAPVLRTDDLRKELFDSNGKSLGYGEKKYSQANRLIVYEELADEVPTLQLASSVVVLDGTFSLEVMRQRCSAAARSAKSEHLHVECVCPREVSLQRITDRRANSVASTSEARPQLYD